MKLRIQFLILKKDKIKLLIKILGNIYRLFAVWEVRTEKYFPEVLEAARDRRSRDATKTEGKYFYSMDRPER